MPGTAPSWNGFLITGYGSRTDDADFVGTTVLEVGCLYVEPVVIVHACLGEEGTEAPAGRLVLLGGHGSPAAHFLPRRRREAVVRIQAPLSVAVALLRVQLDALVAIAGLPGALLGGGEG